MIRKIAIVIAVILFAGVCGAQAQDSTTTVKKHHRNGSIYFSWGYNQEWYTNSDVHIEQDGAKNHYDFVQVQAHDHMGWNDKSILKQAVSIPQYNYRLGYYFNEKQDLGVEINFDHTKYLIANNQWVRQRGIFNGQYVDRQVFFAENQGFYYFLNNGANFLLFNLVKKVEVYNMYHRDLVFDIIGKVGVGPVIPHVENCLFGQVNDKGFQFGGWNTGLETVLRATVKHYAFIEISQKVDYARYSNLKVAGGTASQNFGTYELICSAGFILPTRPHNPMFATEKGNVAGKK